MKSCSRYALIVTEVSRMNPWRDRRKELRQVALQASSVEELLEVVEATVIVMRKHWSEAISTFEDKFRSLSTLLLEHGKVRDSVVFCRQPYIRSKSVIPERE